jgi:hypothetical protein
MSYAFVSLTPDKTYANAYNARKAVEKKLGALDANTNEREFNVYIFYTAEGRAFPVIANINPKASHYAIHLGFCCMN